jgi:hypothetical protein
VGRAHPNAPPPPPCVLRPCCLIHARALVRTSATDSRRSRQYSYRLCPANEKLTEACFQAHQLSFVREEQALVDRSNKLYRINGTFVTEGTFPRGSEWARIPIPSVALGARCAAGPNDTATTPNRCLPGEEGMVGGPCVPCPQTPGSDCSRCDNNVSMHLSRCCLLTAPLCGLEADPTLCTLLFAVAAVHGQASIPAVRPGRRGLRPQACHPRRPQGLAMDALIPPCIFH